MAIKEAGSIDTYLKVEEDEDSWELLTINIHRSLFPFTHLSFGVQAAPTVFQQTMDTMLTGTKGAADYLDAIILTGRTAGVDPTSPTFCGGRCNTEEKARTL